MPLANIAAGLLLALSATQAQERPPLPGPTERVQVTLRQVDFLAVDRRGHPITDLRFDEVRLWDGGQEQPIISLIPAHETPVTQGAPPAPVIQTGPSGPASSPQAPTEPAGHRWVILLFDARNLSSQGRTLAAAAAKEMLDRDLAPTDRVCLMVDDQELRIVVPFTTKREAILRRLDDSAGMTRMVRDVEGRLRELRDNTESCRTAPDILACARQSASAFLLETSRETETSLAHMEALLRGLAAIPDRKTLFYFSEGFVIDPGDVASAAVEHAVGQVGYQVSAMRQFLSSDYRHRLDRLYELATEARVGFYPVNGIRHMTDDLFSAERTQEYGPENLPQARTDPFEAVWDQVRGLHGDLARATGGVALFERDPKGLLGNLVRATAGVYTAAWSPPEAAIGKRRVKIEINRPGARAIYRESTGANLPDKPRDLTGALEVDEASYDAITRRLLVRLTVTGGAFTVAPASEPPTSFVSLFFELRDAGNRPTQELYQTISLPQPKGNGGTSDDLSYPFELVVPPGRYSLRVSIRDLYGPARGSFLKGISVGTTRQ